MGMNFHSLSEGKVIKSKTRNRNMVCVEEDKMIHEITPHVFHGDYRVRKATRKDYVLYFKENEVLLIEKDGQLTLPIGADYSELTMEQVEFLFEIDEKGVFLLEEEPKSFAEGMKYCSLSIFREFPEQYEGFAGITASQLYRWRRDNTYCGRCGHKMENSKVERALVCPECHLTEYPKISPAVIVAVTNQDRMLLTKYANRSYKKYTLVAGFVEIGESLEQTVQREVMEEVGLKVKNIKYFKSSPWSFSDTMMLGFTAELDGEDKITLEENELAEAVWMKIDEVELIENDPSISQSLIRFVKEQYLVQHARQ